MTDKHEQRARRLWKREHLAINDTQAEAITAEFAAVERETVERCIETIDTLAAESRLRGSGSEPSMWKSDAFEDAADALKDFLPPKTPEGE